MFKKIPGSAIYSATLGGKIRNDDTGCEPIIINGKMSIDIYNINYELPVEWLGLLAHYEVFLPCEQRKFTTEIRFVQHNQSVTKANAAYIPVLPAAMHSGKMRIIPGFTDYTATPDGIISETRSGRIITPQKSSNGFYPYVFIYNPDKNTKMEIMVHRLVALAWVDNDDWINKPVVNHLDGNKTNYHCNNLEWVSYSENQIHAGDTGLMSNTVACKMLDVSTGVINTFNSLSQAYRSIGYAGSARITVFDACKRGKLILGRYEFKDIDDDTEWSHLEHNKIGIVNTIIKASLNGEVSSYSIADFKRIFKIWNVSGVNRIINKASNLYPEYKFTIIQLIPNSVSMQGYNLITQEIIEEPSLRLFSSRTGIGINVIKNIYHSKRQRRIGDLLIRRKTEAAWDMEFFEPPSKPKRILATNNINQSKQTFNSLRETAGFFKLDRATIKLRISTQMDINGWYLEYIE